MPELTDLTLENNPIDATAADIRKILSEKLKSLT